MVSKGPEMENNLVLALPWITLRRRVLSMTVNLGLVATPQFKNPIDWEGQGKLNQNKPTSQGYPWHAFDYFTKKWRQNQGAPVNLTINSITNPYNLTFNRLEDQKAPSGRTEIKKLVKQIINTINLRSTEKLKWQLKRENAEKLLR